MNEQAQKKQNRMLLYRFIYLAALGIIVLLAIILYLHFSYGWFAQNDGVTADGMEVTANGDSFFELAVRDRNTVQPANPAYDPGLDQRTPYDAGSAIALYLADDDNGGYEKLAPDYITNNDHPAILCHLVNENPHEEDSEDLAPGAFGVISFDIVLKGDFSSDFDISFSFYPLDKAANGDPKPIVDPAETDPVVQAEQQELLDSLNELLSGHVLFYKTRSVKQNGGYYYSDRLTNDSFTFELPATPDYTDAVTGNRYYTVEIYWIWPSTFGQLALPNGDSRVHVHSVYNNETERGEILSYISTNPDKFFHGLNGNGNFTSSGGESWESLNFIELSEAYNRADQLIGDNAQYLIVCIDVESASA